MVRPRFSVSCKLGKVRGSLSTNLSTSKGSPKPPLGSPTSLVLEYLNAFLELSWAWLEPYSISNWIPFIARYLEIWRSQTTSAVLSITKVW